MYHCIAAKFHEYRKIPEWTQCERWVKWRRWEGRGVKGVILVCLWGHLPDDTLYQSLSLRWWENATFSIFLYDDPNLPPSPSVPADSSRAKEKAALSGSHFVHQQYSTLPKQGRWEEEVVEWAFCLQSPLPSWWSTPAQQAWQQLQWAH